MIWGPIADRFGRVRTMMFSIFCFSLFTLLAAFATGIWSLAIFRFMAGVGIGGEWSVGAALVSEDWPEERRTMGAALMHTGYYIGFFLAAAANRFHRQPLWLESTCSRSAALPALLIGLIRNNVQEPARWENKLHELGEKWTMHRAFLKLFSPQYRRRTIFNTLYLMVSLCGMWAGSVYAPTAMTYIAERSGTNASQGALLASYSTATAWDHYGSGRSDRALSGGLGWAPGYARDFLYGDDVRDLAGVWPRLLHAAECHSVVSGVLGAARPGGSEFHRVFFLAARTVRNRMPRKRVRLYHQFWPLHRRRVHVHGGRWHPPHADVRHSRWP